MADNFNISDVPSAGGASNFLALTDTPASYAGQAGLVATVNGGETALAFTAKTAPFAPKQLDKFTANEAVFVGAAAATGTARNGHSLIAFDDTVDEEIIFESAMSNDYNGTSSILVDLQWAGATAIAGDVKWNVQFERLDEGGSDLDVDDFAAIQTVTEATEGTSGELTYTGITFTNAQADGIQANEAYRLRVIRDATDVADDMVGDAQLLNAVLRTA